MKVYEKILLCMKVFWQPFFLSVCRDYLFDMLDFNPIYTTNSQYKKEAIYTALKSPTQNLDVSYVLNK